VQILRCDCVICITLIKLNFEATTLDNRFEIRLSTIDDVSVDLDRMNADALQSFLEVVSSFKQIAEAVVGKDDLSFAIRAGSALCCLDAPARQLGQIYHEMDLAIEGNSVNKTVTDSLRSIQEQVKKEGLGYEFQYHQASRVIPLHNRIISARRIAVKKTRLGHALKVGMYAGVIKQIGGEHPNYHLDCGNGDKKTIECTVEAAVNINQFLYQTVYALTWVKTYPQHGRQNQYIHVTLVEADQVATMREFVDRYNGHVDILEGLTYIHTFMEAQMEHSQQGFAILKLLLLAFNDQRFHLSEIKTLLVISKPFMQNALLQDARAALLTTYNAKRSQ
jgi:hypothetical protein